jgi:hypothetical protein
MQFDTVIEAPVEKVWPQALKIGSWMTAHRLETVAGEPGKVDHFEQVFPRNLAADVPEPHYHFYGIAAAVPHQYIALEVFPERGGSYGKTRPWLMFDVLQFTDLGGRTRVTFLMIDVQLGKEAVPEAKHDGVADMIHGYFENLKRLVAKSG